MIISASRRTDIPAFYAEWFMNRIEAGFCNVPNPFNANQVSCVSLHPDQVDVIAFWTRHPRPMFSFLDRLDDLGFRYYFQFTILNNPRTLDTRGPSFKSSIQNFQKLSSLIGAERIIWRYDPIVFTWEADPKHHLKNYRIIAQALNGFTQRSVISFVDIYRKNSQRLEYLGVDRKTLYSRSGEPGGQYDDLMQGLIEAAASNGMSIQSCAEEADLERHGIYPGRCIDYEYIEKTFGIQVSKIKDKGQRKLCGCVTSKDIGMYHSCRFGCQYCYATNSYEAARKNSKLHRPTSPTLLG